MEEQQNQEKPYMNFVHLHNHTEFSLLDGICRYKDLVKTAKKMGMPAVAITDHGNMYAYLKFYTECLVSGIKPIIGCEFYVCKDYKDKTGKPKLSHLILLAKNNTGLKNLFKLDSIAFTDGFHFKPRIDYNLLSEHSEGLICLSACLAGDIPQFLLRNELEEAENLAIRLRDMFAPGDFYIELQNHNLPQELEILPKLDALAKKIGVKTVGTNDCHYITKDDAELQDVLMCVQMNKTIDDPNRMKFGTEEFYVKTREEMEKALAGFTECLDTTLEIADKCDVVIKSKAHSYDECHVQLDEKYILPAGKNFIPEYKNPDGTDNYTYMRKIALKGLHEKYPNASQAVIDRFEYELETIKTLGFIDYFLVVWDYINFARSDGIAVGPGRGSGAGSIIAYTMGITDIDPIKYELFFERFINKERVSMPDFDIDFCKNRRLEVVDYTRRVYSPSHVAHIIAYGTMATRACIKDVGRVLNMSFTERDNITKMIPKKLPDGIKKPPVLKYYLGISGEEGKEKYILPDLRELYDSDETIRKVLTLAAKIEGCPRNTTTHACGVLIAPDDVSNIIPLQRNGDEITTQLTGAELESLGLLKMDFLGLRNLTDIELCLNMIKDKTGKVIDFKKVGVDDPKVYELISSGNTDTIFQIESAGFKKYLKELKPDCLEDIIAAVSLYRPGPMDEFPTYIKNKHNPDKIEYASPILEPILNVTYGCIVYQEQVMKIVQDMGGYSLGQADNVRRIMGKKKVEKMAAEKQKFIYGYDDPTGKHSIEGAIKKGVPVEVAEKVFAQMEKFASYAFNKSHAAAYSHITYMTAWLKCYYPVYWLAAYLNNRITNIEKVKQYVAYARTQNIEILPPDINRSTTYFNEDNGKIRYGLSALKGVGESICDIIINERNKNGEFKDLVDFIKRLSDTQAINKRVLEAFILSGTFDCFNKPRSVLMAVYDDIVERCKLDNKKKENGQLSLFDMLGEEDNKMMYVVYPNYPEYEEKNKLKFEKEVVGVYLSGHPLDSIADKLKDYEINSTMFVAEEVPVSNAEYDDPDSTDDYIDEDADNSSIETIKVYNNIKDGQKVKVVGIVSEIKKMNSKSSGKEMAVLKLEDLYGTIDVMFFANVWAKYKKSINIDDIVTINGTISIRESEGSATVLTDSVDFWNTGTEQSKIINVSEVKPEEHIEKLYLKFDLTNIELQESVKKILIHYKGETPVIAKCSVQDKAFSLGKVGLCPQLINELKGVIPENFIVVR